MNPITEEAREFASSLVARDAVEDRIGVSGIRLELIKSMIAQSYAEGYCAAVAACQVIVKGEAK